MASGTAKSPRQAHPVSEPRGQYSQIIDEQLAQTRWRLKLVDLAVMLMLLLGGVILYTLTLVLVDHWVMALSRTVRFLAFGLLVLGAGFYFLRLVFPLLVRRINPCYAARTIEQSDASLKNSVINFLMFRREPTSTGRLVYRALQQRAALDLRRANVDLAIDKSRLINAGYVVVSLMIVFAAYTILSPKDVFQTVARVSLPWADVPRPTRVTIEDVRPGNATVVRGGQVEISAKVLGVGPEDAVTLFYTTRDKQIVDRAVPLQPPETGQYYKCTVPGDPEGVQQDLEYRIEAGDASSPVFRLGSMHVPSIVAEKIEYRYPDYMGRQPRTSEGEGEIRAVEGTKVTVHAKANHEIKQARIEFEPDQKTAADTHKMDSEGQRASYTFRLRWDDVRSAPEHSSYQLIFEPQLSADAAGNLKPQLPAVHKILVTPDLTPEIAILTPRRKEVDLPVNRTQRIEIRAIDPDFGLTKITLRATTADGRNLTKTFPQANDGRTGQVVVEHEFKPAEMSLKPGDRVRLWAEAEDNCTEPNLARTPDYVLRIVPPDPRQAREGDEQEEGSGGQSSRTDNPAEQQTASSQEARNSSGASNQSQSNEAAGGTGSKDQEASSEQQGGQNESEQGQENSEQQSQSGAESGTQGSEGEQGGESSQQSQPAQQGQETEGNQSGSGGQQESGLSGAESGSQQGDGQGDGQGDAGDSSGDSGTSGGSAGSQQGDATQQGNAGQRDAGQRDGGQGNPGGSAEADATQDASAPAQDNPGSESPGGQQSRREPLHDGDAFERLLEYVKNAERAGNPASDDQADAPESPGQADAPRDPGSGSAVGSEDSSGTEKSDGAVGEQSREGTSAGQRGESGNKDEAGSQAGPDGSTSTSDDGSSAESGGDNQENGSDGDGADSREKGGESSRDPAAAGTERADSAETPEGKRSGGGEDGLDPGQRDDGKQEGTDASRDTPAAPDAASGPPDESTLDGGAQSSSDEASEMGVQHDDGGRRSMGEQGAVAKQSDQEAREPSDSGSDSGRGSTGSGQPAGDAAADESQGGQQSPGQGPRDSSQGDQGKQRRDAAPEPNGTRRESPPSVSGAEGGQDSSKADSSEANERTSAGTSRGAPEGGGAPSDSMPGLHDSGREIAEADAANLKYAKKATDLVLERLKDWQDDPDPELLESLGWTEEELQAFAARWETMKRTAREEGADAQRELEDALRSLGLRRSGPKRRAAHAEDDELRGLREDGNRSRPPQELLELFNAYKKGLARGQRNGG